VSPEPGNAQHSDLIVSWSFLSIPFPPAIVMRISREGFEATVAANKKKI
jgi:hypothetical protein